MSDSLSQEQLYTLITDEDMWSVGEGENNGTPFSLRFRPHLQPFINSHLYAKRLVMLWEFVSEDNYLFPTEADMDLMAEVEEKLVEHLEEGAQTVLSFVYTGQNRREWHWYTTDIQVAQDRLNEALSYFDRLPIELTVEEDAHWAEYLSVLEGMEEAEEDAEEE